MEISKEQLAEMINAAIASASKPARKGKKSKGRVRSTPELKATRMAANDAECVRVFTAAGYKDVQPRVNVLTYGRVKPDGTITGWLSKGRRVREGEKALQVGAGPQKFNLFHIDQTDAITVEAAKVETPKAEASAPAGTVFNWNE